MIRDPGLAWPDFLPDLAHLAGCAFAIVLSLFLLPRYAGTVLSAGVAFTAVTYFLPSCEVPWTDSRETRKPAFAGCGAESTWHETFNLAERRKRRV